MKIVEPRNDPVRLFWRRVRLAGLTLLCLLALFPVIDIYHKQKESYALRRQAEAALADLSTRQEHVKERIAQLQTDRGMEEAVRDQYQMGKQGEGMIVIVDKEVPREETATSSLRAFMHKVMPWW